MTEAATPEIADLAPKNSTMLTEVLAGLRAKPKVISPKYFYDERGSELFERITELPEYYPTRTEIAIMQDNMAEIAELIGPQASLIEFGSGSSMKTRMLLENLPALAAYVPVEISGDFLQSVANELQQDFPGIEILPVIADFTKPFDLPTPAVMPVKNVVYFPGSTIGNFSPPAALDLLRVMATEAKKGGGLLIGVDLKKDKAVLEAAYNDAEGVTARFNRNMLRHLNEELDADFEPDAFRHLALYDEDKGRIEMHLVSLRVQTFHVGGERFEMAEGESIRTECSYKFTLDEFADMAEQAGFRVRRVWTDPARLFSVQYLECVAL